MHLHSLVLLEVTTITRFGWSTNGTETRIFDTAVTVSLAVITAADNTRARFSQGRSTRAIWLDGDVAGIRALALVLVDLNELVMGEWSKPT